MTVGQTALRHPLHWHPEVFTLDRRRAALGTAPFHLDITGPPRALVYGPYFDLEPGTWRAQVRFTVDEAACLRRYRLEWGGLVSFATHAFVPGLAGVYALEIDHHWATTVAAETRLILTEGAIDGTVEFLGVTVSRLA